MVERLDETLLAARDRPVREGGFGGAGGPGGGPDPPGGERGPSDLRSVAQVVAFADGTSLADPAGFVDDPEPLPALPDVGSAEAEAMVGRIVTVPATDG